MNRAQRIAEGVEEERRGLTRTARSQLADERIQLLSGPVRVKALCAASTELIAIIYTQTRRETQRTVVWLNVSMSALITVSFLEIVTRRWREVVGDGEPRSRRLTCESTCNLSAVVGLFHSLDLVSKLIPCLQLICMA